MEKAAPVTASARVLVVDDSPTSAHALAELLELRGYATAVAAGGPEALARAAEAPPDLVLLDVVMDGMDGFETCARLHRLPGCGDVPVIFLTALTDMPSKVRAFEAGGVDHVSKPFDPREVLARVAAHVALRRLRYDLAERNAQLQRTVTELEEALESVRTLRGLLPICSHCKRIRDDQGYWHRVEAYVSAHSPATFTHGICPGCLEEHYPEGGSGETKTGT